MEMKIDILKSLCDKDYLQSELSNRLQINPSVIKPLLTSMRKNGLISREWIDISITTKGREIADLAKRVQEELKCR